MGATRVLVDSSTLIALANTGRLDLLRRLFGTVYTTKVVKAEVLAGDYPENTALEAAFDQGWIETVTVGKGKGSEKWEQYGLGPGEASLFSVASKDDRLVLDDRNARRFAQSRGHLITGLLSLIVHSAGSGVATPDEMRRLLRALARSEFRMNVELYEWVLDQLSRIQE